MQPAKIIIGEQATIAVHDSNMTSMSWIQVSTRELIEEIIPYRKKKKRAAYIGVSGLRSSIKKSKQLLHKGPDCPICQSPERNRDERKHEKRRQKEGEEQKRKK